MWTEGSGVETRCNCIGRKSAGFIRVWGAMRGCSHKTVFSALQLWRFWRLMSVGSSGKVVVPHQRWWDNPADPNHAIEISTSWKFECCYQVVSPSTTHNLVAQPLVHNTSFVSCWLCSCVARPWYRGPGPWPWVLALEAGVARLNAF